jgi:predicted acyl esterase
MRVTAQADSVSFDVMAALVVVDEGGSAREVSSGGRRLLSVASAGPVDVVVELRPIAIVVPPGGRLRLDISASRFPALGRNPQAPGVAAQLPRSGYRVATIEVLSAAIDLPVVV